MSYAYRPGYIQKNFKSGTKVATFQSGTLGYFLPNIYNLDGKVDINAVKYSRDGNIDRYIDMLGIEALVEWKPYLPNINENYLEENWDLYSSDIGDSRSVCYVRKNLNREKKQK